MRITIVDDSVQQLRVLARLVKMVVPASVVNTSLTKPDESLLQQTNLLLIDNLLDGYFTGVQLVREWRKKDFTAPVIFVSADRSGIQSFKDNAIPNAIWLSKPYRASTLEKVVLNGLERGFPYPDVIDYEHHLLTPSDLVLHHAKEEAVRETQVLTARLQGLMGQLKASLS